MKLIVEGPDGSGKTTLINNLGLKRLHLKSLRGGVGGTTAAGWAGQDEAPTAYARRLREEPDGTAFDRFYLSELVYGPLLRGQAAITEDEAVLVRRVECALGIQTILCLPGWTRTWNNVTEAGRERPEYQTRSFLLQAWLAWSQMAWQARGKHYNFETDQIPVLAPRPTMPDDRLIGSPTASILIVTADDLYLPALSMTDLSAATLNRALWYAGLSEESLAFTNALHWAPTAGDSQSSPSGVKAALLASTKIVIAVGELAERHLLLADLANGLPHCPLVFTVAEPRFTTVTNLSSTFRTIADLL